MFGHWITLFPRGDEKAPEGWAQSKTWRRAQGPMAVAAASWSAVDLYRFWWAGGEDVWSLDNVFPACRRESARGLGAVQNLAVCSGAYGGRGSALECGRPLPLFGGRAGKMFGHWIMFFPRADEKAPEGWAQSKTWRCAQGPMAVAAASWSAVDLYRFWWAGGEDVWSLDNVFPACRRESARGLGAVQNLAACSGAHGGRGSVLECGSLLPLFGGRTRRIRLFSDLCYLPTHSLEHFLEPITICS